MGPALAIVAGVLLDKMQEAQARKQAIADLYMQRARDLNPQTPTYLYDAQRTNAEIEARRGQNVARLLPLALQNAFSESAPDRSSVQYASDQFRPGGTLYKASQDVFPINPFRGLGPSPRPVGELPIDHINPFRGLGPGEDY